MKIDEAIKAQSDYLTEPPMPYTINKTVWCRPIGWKGSGQAIMRAGNGSSRLVIVPSRCGGDPWYPHYNDIVDEWELVDADVVLDEV